MIRIFHIHYAEHVAFQPDPINVGTAKNPDATADQPHVDTWRKSEKRVAVQDGWGEAAIARLKEVLATEDAEGHVQEVEILALALVSEAE